MLLLPLKYKMLFAQNSVHTTQMPLKKKGQQTKYQNTTKSTHKRGLELNTSVLNYTADLFTTDSPLKQINECDTRLSSTPVMMRYVGTKSISLPVLTCLYHAR